MKLFPRILSSENHGICFHNELIYNTSLKGFYNIISYYYHDTELTKETHKKRFIRQNFNDPRNTLHRMYRIYTFGGNIVYILLRFKSFGNILNSFVSSSVI